MPSSARRDWASHRESTAGRASIGTRFVPFRGAKPRQIHTVRDDDQFFLRQTAPLGGELGNAVTDADVAIDEEIGHSVEPKPPATAAIGHTNAGHHPCYASPPRGNPSDDIGVKKESLGQLGILLPQESLQSVED